MSLIKDIDQIFTCNNIIKNHFKKMWVLETYPIMLEKKTKLVNNKRI